MHGLYFTYRKRKSKLDYFISVSAKYPVIATTSKLLSTGADCKMTKLFADPDWDGPIEVDENFGTDNKQEWLSCRDYS